MLFVFKHLKINTLKVWHQSWIALSTRYSAMLKNYFKTAVRNLLRNRTFAIINILGLVLGISGTIVIYRIISFEKSFDTYHSDTEQIYRINLVQENEGGINRSVSVMHPLGPAVRTDYPDWTISRIHHYGPGIFKVENGQGVEKKFRETQGMAFVEEDFFQIFNFNIIAGNPDRVLDEPNTMALSESAASKLFDLNGQGYQSVIGKTVMFENKLNLRITAVYQDPPKNTDYAMNYLMFYEGAKIYPYAAGLTNWGTRNGATRLWVKLPNGQTELNAELQLRESSKKYLSNVGSSGDKSYFALEPILDIHLDEETGNGGMISTSVVRGMTVLAVILIITAAINFVNLATAQSVKRAKEIGIRKVLGSKKHHLVGQFLGEVFLITLISVLLSLGISEAALMQLEPLLGYSLGLELFSEPLTIVFLVLILVVVTLLSGFYPSMVLANYNPILAIKSSSLNAKANGKSMSIRRGLVILQFLISQSLIIGTLVIVYQMNYMSTKPLGFDSEAIVTFSVPERTDEKMSLLKSRLQGISGVGDISFYIGSPGAANMNNLDAIKSPLVGEGETFGANRKNVDPYYADLFDLKLLAGEFYREEAPGDYSVINRKFAESLGYDSPEEAVGQRYETRWGRKYIITGIVEDFHNNSLHSDISPVFMMSGPSQYFEAGVKLNLAGGFQETLDQINQVWSDVFSADVFTYQFLDDRVALQYQSEKQVSALLQVFAGIAIFIGCLGLYGLVSFMANQKVKEIGIRKVLGATVKNIIAIFSKEVGALVFIAFVLAAPIGYYLMNDYLNGFAYRIDMGANVFVVAVLVTVIIAISTVGLRAFRAASSNPVKSLRDE